MTRTRENNSSSNHNNSKSSSNSNIETAAKTDSNTNTNNSNCTSRCIDGSNIICSCSNCRSSNKNSTSIKTNHLHSSLVLWYGWPGYEGEGGEQEVDGECEELSEEDPLDEALPLGLEEVHNDALNKVEVLDKFLKRQGMCNAKLITELSRSNQNEK